MSAPELIDTHCHLDFEDFDHDRQQLLDRCQSLGVKQIIVPAVSANTFTRTSNCCRSNSHLHLALGMHPIFIDQHQPHHLLELDNALSDQPAVAVGEIGLDFYRKDLDQEKQIAFFTKQLIIAKRHQLPVIIHNRKAHDQCLALLAQHGVKAGIIHAFNGSLQQGLKYHQMGFKLGFGGMLTFSRSNKLRKLATDLPLESLVLETDAPDMTVAQHQGERNSPEYLPMVLDALAELRPESKQDIAEATTQNAADVLGLPDYLAQQ